MMTEKMVSIQAKFESGPKLIFIDGKYLTPNIHYTIAENESHTDIYFTCQINDGDRLTIISIPSGTIYTAKFISNFTLI